ncbi:MAG: asparagine synthase-related protein [Acidimicrobiia bacterium]
MTEELRLTPLEVASGLVVGTDRSASPLTAPEQGVTPRGALERAVREGLLRAPCLVSFSGGRDSSTMLALAVGVARREGLDLPVPVSLRFPDVDSAQEGEWQEQVVRHLGLTEWVRLAFDDQLDLVGPYAEGVLLRHGLVWPANAHFLVPLLEQAPGGSLITGVFGDEVFSQLTRLVRVREVLARRRPPQVRDILRIGLAMAPPWVRRPILSRRRLEGDAVPGWLRPAARRLVEGALSKEEAGHPLPWSSELHRFWRQRYTQLLRQTLRLLSADHRCQVIAPFGDPGFLAAFARAGGFAGFHDRTEALAAVAGKLLPRRVLERPTKATFTGTFLSRHTDRFAAGWDGAGVEGTLVDPELVRRVWLGDSDRLPPGVIPRDFRSAHLLQAAWLARRGRHRVA